MAIGRWSESKLGRTGHVFRDVTVALDVQKGDAKFESDPLRHSCTCPVGPGRDLNKIMSCVQRSVDHREG